MINECSKIMLKPKHAWIIQLSAIALIKIPFIIWDISKGYDAFTIFLTRTSTLLFQLIIAMLYVELYYRKQYNIIINNTTNG